MHARIMRLGIPGDLPGYLPDPFPKSGLFFEHGG
jgi:hypothetical protein